jgi:hypothetical protein
MPELSNSASTTFRRAITGAVMIGAAALGSASTGHTQPASVAFTPAECKYVTNLLLDEMEHYKSRLGDANSVMTPTLIKSAKQFIGLDREQMLCDGPAISWSTRGDKSILDAVALRLNNLERNKKIPTKDLAYRFMSAVGKSAQSASLEPSPQ